MGLRDCAGKSRRQREINARHQSQSWLYKRPRGRSRIAARGKNKRNLNGIRAVRVCKRSDPKYRQPEPITAPSWPFFQIINILLNEVFPIQFLRSKNRALTLLKMGERFWFNANSMILNRGLIERHSTIIGCRRVGVDGEGQRMTEHFDT
jgi:hypothetical protein